MGKRITNMNSWFLVLVK